MLVADVLDAERAETSYRSLIGRAWPIILANAAVPTLGLVDTAIIGNVATTIDLGAIALGAVIRGGTPHFGYVAGECVKGLGQVMLNTSKPVTFGVLTVDSIEQAIERSGTKAGNKGEEAAITAVEMVSLMRQLDA